MLLKSELIRISAITTAKNLLEVKYAVHWNALGAVMERHTGRRLCSVITGVGEATRAYQ